MDENSITAISHTISEAYYSFCGRTLASRPRGRGEQEIATRIEGAIKTVNMHHKFENQEKALATIPVDLIHERVGEILESAEKVSHPEALTKVLLNWFKKEFFQWVDTVACTRCQAKTVSQGATAPTTEEQRFGAGVVELHSCPSCGQMNRFPRYNDPVKLLETRRGRCGEWANCFGLILASMGLECRYIIDFTDHVWNEVFIDGEWKHCDSCENALNQPLLYEGGWGKKLNYCFSVSLHQVVDSTRRYTTKYPEVLTRRKLLSEIRLFLLIRSLNHRMKQGLDPSLLKEIQDAEGKELNSLLHSNAIIDYSTLVPRQSGSIEWRTARGEMGGSEGL